MATNNKAPLTPGDWAKISAKFISVEIGEEVEVIYRGFKIVPDKFNPEKECIQYTFETEWGNKLFESKSLTIARAIDTVKIGDKIKLRKEKFGDKGRYVIEKVKSND